MNVLIWSYSCYDLIGLMAEELKDTKRLFKRAVMLILVLSIGTYYFTLIASLGEIDTLKTNTWGPGYFAVVAEQVGGKFLMVCG